MSLNTDRIEKDVRKLRNLVKKLPRNPTPEEIHRLRTRVRRFEVELQASGLDAQRKENGCSNSSLASGREPAKSGTWMC